MWMIRKEKGRGKKVYIADRILRDYRELLDGFIGCLHLLPILTSEQRETKGSNETKLLVMRRRWGSNETTKPSLQSEESE